MRTLFVGAAMLALTGCGPAEAPKREVAATPSPTPSPTPTPGPMLGGVDLHKPVRATGTGWTIDLAPGRITYTARGKDGVELYPLSPVLSEGRARYATKTPEGEAATIELIERACGNASLTVEAMIGSRSLRGCAQAR